MITEAAIFQSQAQRLNPLSHTPPHPSIHDFPVCLSLLLHHKHIKGKSRCLLKKKKHWLILCFLICHHGKILYLAMQAVSSLSRLCAKRWLMKSSCPWGSRWCSSASIRSLFSSTWEIDEEAHHSYNLVYLQAFRRCISLNTCALVFMNTVYNQSLLIILISQFFSLKN